MIGWSRNDVTHYSELIGLNVIYNGYGFVTNMNKSSGSEINLSETLEITLEQKYKPPVVEEEIDASIN